MLSPRNNTGRLVKPTEPDPTLTITEPSSTLSQLIVQTPMKTPDRKTTNNDDYEETPTKLNVITPQKPTILQSATESSSTLNSTESEPIKTPKPFLKRSASQPRLLSQKDLWETLGHAGIEKPEFKKKSSVTNIDALKKVYELSNESNASNGHTHTSTTGENTNQKLKSSSKIYSNRNEKTKKNNESSPLLQNPKKASTLTKKF